MLHIADMIVIVVEVTLFCLYDYEMKMRLCIVSLWLILKHYLYGLYFGHCYVAFPVVNDKVT